MHPSQEEEDSSSEAAAQGSVDRTSRDFSMLGSGGIELGPIGLTFGGALSGGGNEYALLHNHTLPSIAMANRAQ